MIYRTMKATELDSWAEHCASVFSGPTDTPDYFRDHYRFDPFHDPDGVMIAEDNGEIVATVRVFTREIYLKGFRVSMGGIGEVSTKKTYRGQGISGNLLKMAIDYMERKHLNTSLLFTGINRHYARYGWFTTARRFVTPSLDSVPQLDENLLLRPLTENDLPAARGLYALTAGRFDGALVREHPDYWRDWMRPFWKNPLALFQNDRMLAYMDLHIDEEKNEILLRDYATEPDTDWWQAMLAHYANAQPTPVKIKIPAPLMPACNGPFAENGDAMWRLNAPFDLGDQRIDTAGKLAAALADSLFWGPDSF